MVVETSSFEAPASTARGANPYRRAAWERPGSALGASPHLPHPLAHLRVLPLVAAVGLSVFLLIAVFQLVDMYSVPAQGVLAPAAPAEAPRAGDGSEAASTPRDQWRAGQVPFLYQIDPAWSAAPYAGSDVETAGCGPTSLAMVYIALTGKTNYDPESMAAFSEQNGYVESGMTAWRFMTDGAAALGLSSHEVPADAGRLRAELAAGRPVICSVGPGDFTETGHFIVLAGLADDGQLVVRDPNSPSNSARVWDVDRVLGQCRNIWAFERA